MKDESFCMRGFSECSVEHPLFIAKSESDIKYFDRMVEYWQARFDKFGAIYMLPHHFVDQVIWIQALAQLANRNGALTKLGIALSDGVREGYAANISERVAEMHPIVKQVPGNFNVPYNEDLMGKNLVNKNSYSLAEVAYLMAIVTSSQPFTIGCNHTMDGNCFAANVFGTGKHCLANSISQYQKVASGTNTGDIKIMELILSVIEKEKMDSSGICIKKAYIHSETEIKMSRPALLNTYGSKIYDGVVAILQEEYDSHGRLNL